MGKFKKRIISLLAILLMLFTIVPTSLAENADSTSGDTQNSPAVTANVDITASVTLDGEAPDTGSLSFDLLDENGSSIQSGVTNDGSSITFDAVNVQAAGTYNYKIQQTGTPDSVTCTPAELSVQAVVDEAGTVSVTYPDGQAFTDTTAQQEETPADTPAVASGSADYSVATAATSDKKTATLTDVPGEYTIKLETSGSTVTQYQTRDYVIVIDRSGSMDDNNKLKALKNALNGTTTSGDTGDGSTSGFLHGIFEKSGNDSSHTYTRVKFVTFSNSSSSTQWYTSATSAASYISNLSASGGTNYVSALNTASTELSSSTADQKYMIFLSDGDPTFYKSSDDESDGNWGSKTSVTTWQNTVAAIADFRTSNPTVNTYSIAFGTSQYANVYSSRTYHWFTGYKYTACGAQSYEYEGTTYTISGTGKHASQYNFMDQLSPGKVKEATTESINTILSDIVNTINNMSNVVIYDPINTDYFEASIDADLAKSNFTASITDDKGTRVLAEGTDYTLEHSGSAIKLSLTDVLKGTETLTVQFNVKVSEAGYAKVFQDGVTSVNTNGDFAYSSGIVGNEQITSEYVNPTVSIPTTSISLNKTDDNGNGLTGSKFQITRKSEDTTVADQTRTIDLSDASSIDISSLPKGSYTIKEIQAPANYVLDDSECTFNVTESIVDGSMTAAVTDMSATGNYSWDGSNAKLSVKNKPSTFSYAVTKTDENNQKLSGATFSLYNAKASGNTWVKDGDAIQTLTTNATTNPVVFTNLSQGHYILEEVSAPENYQKISDVILDFTDKTSPKADTTSLTYDQDSNTVSQTIQNNLKDCSVKLTKTVKGGLGRVDDEFTFHVVIKNGETTISETDVKLTGNPVNGANTTTIQGKAGYTYTITETVPTGYTASINGTKTNTVTGTFTADETTSVNVTNTAAGDVPTSLLVYNGPYIAMGVGVVVLGAMWFMLKRKKHSA